MRKFIINAIVASSFAVSSVAPAFAESTFEREMKGNLLPNIAGNTGSQVIYELMSEVCTWGAPGILCRGGVMLLATLVGTTAAAAAKGGMNSGSTLKQDLKILQDFRAHRKVSGLRCNEDAEKVTVLPNMGNTYAYFYACTLPNGGKGGYVLLGVNGDQGYGLVWEPDPVWADVFPWSKLMVLQRKGHKKPLITKVPSVALHMAKAVKGGSAPKLRLP